MFLKTNLASQGPLVNGIYGETQPHPLPFDVFLW